MSSNQNRGMGRDRGGPRGGQSGGQRGGQRSTQSGGQGDGQRSGQSQASGSSQRGGQRSYDRPSYSSGDSGGGYGRQQFGGQRSQSSGDWQRGRRDDRGGHRGGGGDGQRGFRSQSYSPIRRDIREIAERVHILPKSRSKGTKGKSVELITNHFRLIATKELEETKICHYDITVCRRRRDNIKTEVKNQIEKKQIIERMAEEWREVLPPNTYAYDGQKNLFVIQELGIGEEEVNREVVMTLDGFPEQTFDVKIKFVRNVSMKEITTSNFDGDHQVLDIVLRHRMLRFGRNIVGVGRNVFNRDDKNTKKLEEYNCSIGFGHHQSIHNTQCGLTVNVDRVTTTFRSDGPLTDFIKRELKVNDLNSVNYDNNTLRFLTKSLRDLKIYSEHIKINGVPQKRKSVIEVMTSIRPIEHSFETEPGKSVTLYQYFKSKYGITLQLTEVPLIKIKGGTRENPKYLPIELCTVYPNQKMPRNLITHEIQSEIVSSTNSQKPLKRFEKIQNSLETIITESQALMKSFGLQIIDHPIELTGRELKQPTVTDPKKLNVAVSLKDSLFLNLSPSVRPQLNQYFDNFFNNPDFGLIKTGRQMGLSVKLPKIVGQNLNINNLENQMQAFESFIKDVNKGSVQMVFVCIPDNRKLHGRIKYLAEIEFGVITQCIKDQKFKSTKKGYFNNFLLKTNAKLNGQNIALIDSSNEYRPKIFTDPKNLTMIIGADVTHPAFDNPLANENVISSIAAIVGSYDKDFTKFLANVSAQPPKTEFITDFGVMFENLLKGFFQINGKYPQNIVLFRDGVSDSQLDSVENEEIPQIEAILRKKGIPKPMITAYVVQKRHHTRFILKNPIIDFKGNELFNMKSGTVVDHTITKASLKEFHLCSHKGLLGTSRHSKYVVIRNDYKLSADELQLLAFSTCFAYCRCMSPISIPIPVKYADLAAYRAKQYADAMNDIFESAHPNETLDQKRARETRNIRLLNAKIVVDETIKFIPYYC